VPNLGGGWDRAGLDLRTAPDWLQRPTCQTQPERPVSRDFTVSSCKAILLHLIVKTTKTKLLFQLSPAAPRHRRPCANNFLANSGWPVGARVGQTTGPNCEGS
jgi:hypothetical protein